MKIISPLSSKMSASTSGKISYRHRLEVRKRRRPSIAYQSENPNERLPLNEIEARAGVEESKQVINPQRIKPLNYLQILTEQKTPGRRYNITTGLIWRCNALCWNAELSSYHLPKQKILILKPLDSSVFQSPVG